MFWFFVLFNFLASCLLAVVDVVTGGFNYSAGMGPIGGLYGLAIFIPSLAVCVRRLHDTNRSGWWVLIGLIPLLGALVLLYFAIQDGTPGANQYGPNPKGVGA